jgi:uncharacterized protein YfaA (DUF2138 family)
VAIHPERVVETASLASVAPANLRYNLNLPDKTIDSGSLSKMLEQLWKNGGSTDY